MTQNEAAQLWDVALTLLEQQEGKDRPSLLAMCGKLIPRALSADEIVVSTSNEYVKGFIERNYLAEVVQSIRFASGKDYCLRIVVSEEQEEAPVQKKETVPVLEQEQPLAPLDSASFIDHQTTQQTPRQTDVFVEHPSERSLEQNAAKTFETLVVGESNRFAYEVARGVAENPGRHIYNPLFLYGKSGLGKTHILLSIEDYVHTNHPHMKVVYTRSSDFIDDFMTMLKYKDDQKYSRDFIQKYRMVDMIIIDDVQYIQNKQAVTNELYNIFNLFVDQNKQVVLSADRNPYNLDLDERHRSRFIKGGPIDIQPATYEMKLAIFENCLNYFCQDMKRPDICELFHRDVIDWIVGASSSNIRELEGIIANLVGYLILSGPKRYERLSIEEAEEQIRKNFQLTGKQVDIPTIQKAIEEYFQVSHSDILGSQRSQDISYPRQVAMYLARSMTQHSFPVIGRAFGGKDHSTVVYACNNIERRSMESLTTKQEIENIREMILQ